MVMSRGAGRLSYVHTVVVLRRESRASSHEASRAGVLQVVQTPVKELGERSFPKSQVEEHGRIICDIIRRKMFRWLILERFAVGAFVPRRVLWRLPPVWDM